MDPRYAWMVTLAGDFGTPAPSLPEGMSLSQDGARWLGGVIQTMKEHGVPITLQAGEWALHADRFESLDDSIAVTHAAQAILDEAQLGGVRPAIVVQRVKEPAGFGYSIWSAFDSLYIGADSPLNPDKNPGGR